MKTKPLILFLCLILISCGNGSNSSRKSFSPTKREHGQLIINNDNTERIDEETNNTWVKLSILLPYDEAFDASQQRRIEGKMLQLFSTLGIAGNGQSNPKHIIAPIFELASLEATSTAPTKYMAKYNITLYIADIVSGTVFNSLHQQISGVGRSKEEAYINAMESLTPNKDFVKFVNIAQDRIFKYYKDNGDAILAEANTMDQRRDYSSAIALLESIPIADSLHYSLARSKIDAIIPKYLKAISDDLLVKMKVALGSAPSDTINVIAMEYYQMIPTDSPCKAEADMLYNNYLNKLSSEQLAKAERQMKQLEADNSFRLREAELKAEVEGNTMLLEKYKKDAAYERLPWLRKLVYLGDRDPFDGYEPQKNI